jgi:hypothetical protein
VQSLTRDDFLELLRLEPGTFEALQHRGQVALAFGATLPGTPGVYLDMDLVAMAITLGLSPSLGRDSAAAIVLRFAAMWAATVARAEAERTRDFFLGIGALGVRDPVKKIPKLYGVTHGTMAEISEDLQAQSEPLMNACLVNVSDIIRRLRESGREAGINLESEFFFLPDDPRFVGIQRAIEREIEARFNRLKSDKKKLARAKTRSRRQDIKNVSRQPVTYPIEMVTA